jgi:alpha-D-xyloside xylohydrolase
MLRPLVMDFRADDRTWNIRDQFMFGPALLVSPVEQDLTRERPVYLPKNAQWYDFWTGERSNGGQQLQSSAPLDRIPLYVRAGSILPLGPDEEYADEKPDGPFELRIYEGADGAFTLYQDAGDGYGYEKGQFSEVPIAWSQAGRVLTLGARKGAYPGMPAAMTFHIVCVRPGHGVGGAVAAQPDKTVTYSGSALRITPE